MMDTPEGITALHVASKKGYHDIAKLLLENDCNVSSKTIEGQTPLHFAAMSGSYKTCYELIKHGARVVGDDNNITPIDIAQQVESKDKEKIMYILKITFDKEAGLSLIPNEEKFISFCNENNDRIKLHGSMFLVEAAKQNKIRIVSFLLKSGIRGDAVEDDDEKTLGNSALHYSAKNGNESMTCLLIQRGAKFITNKEGKTPLDYANNEIVKLILKIEFLSEIVSPDVCAAVIKSKRIEVLISILNSKFDINSTTKNGKPIICCAASCGDKSIVRLLLSHGPILTKTTKNGLTALHIASSKDNIEIAKEFIKCGVPNTKDSFGKLAIEYSKSEEMRTLLSEYGTFLEELESVKGKEQVKNLVKKYKTNVSLYGTQMAFASIMFHSLHSLKYLLEHGVSANCRDCYSNTLLHIAAASNDIQSGILLLEQGANIDSRNSENATPLNIAAAKNNDVFVELLIANKCDINSVSRGNMSSIMHCSRLGNKKCLKILKQSGANLDTENLNGETALSLSKSRKLTSITKILVN